MPAKAPYLFAYVDRAAHHDHDRHDDPLRRAAR
jgi:hypothetical protein